MMKNGFELTRVLITVMTYPHPSQKYQECVCTAGITDAKEWVRLYPIDYRYRPEHQKFKKWQRVEVALGPLGHGGDRRRESRKPDLASFRILGERLSPKKSWRERREIIDAMPHHTVKQLESLYDAERVSLGIVRPKKVLDFKATPTTREWKPEWQALWSQMRLFGNQKPLKKIPYKFQYVFQCEDDQKPRQVMNEDWELGMLFLKECVRLGSEEAAIKSVRHKFLDEVCGSGKDTRFFMGTRFPYNEWLVIGTFWPPKERQPSLFSGAGA